MKQTIFSLALCFVAACAFAQHGGGTGSTKFAIGAGIGVATSNPLKDFQGNKGWGLGFGGMIQVEHFFHNQLSGVAQGGIVTYAGRAYGGSGNTKNRNYRTVPIRAGGNGYIGNLHLGALVGVGLNSIGSDNRTAFAYSPQIGYNFSRNDLPLDLTMSYEGYAGHGGFSAFLLRLSLVL